MASRGKKQIEIINAAIRVFSKCGFDGAKMEHIAKEAGIGKGTVYEYFTSKYSLFEESLKYSVDQYQLGLKQSLDQGQKLEEKMLNCSRFNAQFLKHHMDFVHIAMQVKILSEDLRHYHLAVQSVIIEYYKEMIKAAKEKKEVRDDLNEELASCCIIGALDQFCMQRIFLDPRPLEDIDHQGIIDVVLRGLR